MSEPAVIASSHRLVENGIGGLHDILTEDAVFHPPVVHTPQRGRAIVERYLAAAFTVFVDPSFRYVGEVVGELDGIHVNGVDMLRCNAAGRIVDFQVMVRPLKGIDTVCRNVVAILSAAD